MASGGTDSAASGGPGGRSDHGPADPMEQYIQALSSDGRPNPASVRAVLHQALTNPRVFAGFAELRSLTPVIKALEGAVGSVGGGDAALRTLELFAWGTFTDYVSAAEGTYLRLTDAQAHKLRQLTVVNHVRNTAAEAAEKADISKKKKVPETQRRGRRGGGRGRGLSSKSSSSGGASVPYSSLRLALGLPADSHVRDMEDLLISCIYSGLVVGRLDQRTMSLLVGPQGGGGHGSAAHQPPCATRDVRVPEDLTAMIEALETFHRRGDEVVRSLGEAAYSAREGRDEDGRRWAAAELRIAEIRSKAKERSVGMGGGGAEGSGMGDAWGSMDAMGGGDDGMAMNISVEAGGSVPPGGLRRQTKRSRGGYSGGFADSYGRY